MLKNKTKILKKIPSFYLKSKTMQKITLEKLWNPLFTWKSVWSFPGKLKGTKTLRILPTTCRSSKPPQNYNPDVMHQFLPIYMQAHTLGTCKSYQPNSNYGISPSVQLRSRLRVESDQSRTSQAHSLIVDHKSWPVIYPCESIGLLRSHMTSPPQGCTRPHFKSESAYDLIPTKSQIIASRNFPIEMFTHNIKSHTTSSRTWHHVTHDILVTCCVQLYVA